MLTILLGLSAVYAVLGGGVGLLYPNAWTKMDFNLFYEVGNLAWQGINPYTDAGSGAFAYPPAWIALCALLSSLPWWLSVTLWKSFNLLFLAGSVWVSARLFGLHLTDPRTKLLLSFSCLLWPTLTVLKEGQTSLFILFFALGSIWLSRQGKPIAAGATLCLALMKPQLAAPLLILFAWRRQFSTVVWALVFFSSLSFVGLWLSNASLSSYVGASFAYAVETTTNEADNPHNVGIQNVSAILLGLSSGDARLVGLVAGVMFLIYLFVRDRRNLGLNKTADLIPLILLSGVAFFGARSYDLVFVIPFFAWLVSHANDSVSARVGVVCCVALVVPLRAVMVLYRTFLSSFIPAAYVVLAPFRSYVLFILLVSGLMLYLKRPVQRILPSGNRLQIAELK